MRSDTKRGGGAAAELHGKDRVREKEEQGNSTWLDSLRSTTDRPAAFSVLTGLGGILHELVQAVGQERVEVAHEHHRCGEALRAGLPHVVEAIREADFVLQGDLPPTTTPTHTHTHRCTHTSAKRSMSNI